VSGENSIFGPVRPVGTDEEDGRRDERGIVSLREPNEGDLVSPPGRRGYGSVTPASGRCCGYGWYDEVDGPARGKGWLILGSAEAVVLLDRSDEKRLWFWFRT
jgi:hypothetical protein